MPQTLRRSCAACAKSKHSCDLRTPRCSRCVKRGVQCLYANQPLTLATPVVRRQQGEGKLHGKPIGSLSTRRAAAVFSDHRLGSLDPFDSYPPTRLPRERVQRLIHSFLHKIAFQYYPLDLNATSNPFLTLWWPRALGDPTLFHVSLQTACLDEELLAQKGFQMSDLLMADSVTLLRRKVADTSLALQDETMNSVITLAAIELGKGNIKVSRMHVEGVKRLFNMRGGINSVRRTSPLTARMVSWISLLVMGHPQFNTQDDDGTGDGIPPIPEWRSDSISSIFDDDPELSGLSAEIDHAVWNVLVRLRSTFHRIQQASFPTTRLHDLTCFVVHRLLLTVQDVTDPLTECIRHGIILYMLIVQGPTYFSPAVLLEPTVARLIDYLEQLDSTTRVYNSLDVWLVATGMVASAGSAQYQWFIKRAQTLNASMKLGSLNDVAARIKRVLWLETLHGEDVFRPHWCAVLSTCGCQAKPTGCAICISPPVRYLADQNQSVLLINKK